MEELTITLPKLGESIQNATIIQWFKKEGEAVALDEPLLEVATDKVNSEIPAPFTGILKKILVGADQEVDVGAALAILSTSEAVILEAAKPKAPVTERCFLSPAVLRLAREQGIEVTELDKIAGSGTGGRVTKKDLEAYLNQPKAGGERVKVTRMRKAIADHMVRSFSEIPSATLVSEIDITGPMEEIRRTKETFFQEHGYKLSITSYIARALSHAALEFPLVNSSFEGDTILLKRSVNLGIAVSLDDGLIVPVIKQCDRLSLPEIAERVALLSEKARSGTLSPDDVQGSTLTMSNFGMSGITIGIPILPLPEAAIIGVGAIQKRVVALSDTTFGVRQILHLSLTFDHRVFDGMYGCGYLNAVKTKLEFA